METKTKRDRKGVLTWHSWGRVTRGGREGEGRGGEDGGKGREEEQEEREERMRGGGREGREDARRRNRKRRERECEEEEQEEREEKMRVETGGDERTWKSFMKLSLTSCCGLPHPLLSQPLLARGFDGPTSHFAKPNPTPGTLSGAEEQILRGGTAGNRIPGEPNPPISQYPRERVPLLRGAHTSPRPPPERKFNTAAGARGFGAAASVRARGSCR